METSMDNTTPDSSTNDQSYMLNFTLTHLKPSAIGPRLGQLHRGGRKIIETPHYVATTSRGVVPHVSHDALRKHTAVSSIHLGLEDCKRLPVSFTVRADLSLTAPS
jgi:queuine tRNA-ribosyltransferase accessory subunit